MYPSLVCPFDDIFVNTDGLVKILLLLLTCEGCASSGSQLVHTFEKLALDYGLNFSEVYTGCCNLEFPCFRYFTTT
jgi:hypothetical protein